MLYMCCYGAARVNANITPAGPRIPAGRAKRIEEWRTNGKIRIYKIETPK